MNQKKNWAGYSLRLMELQLAHQEFSKLFQKENTNSIEFIDKDGIGVISIPYHEIRYLFDSIKDFNAAVGFIQELRDHWDKMISLAGSLVMAINKKTRNESLILKAVSGLSATIKGFRKFGECPIYARHELLQEVRTLISSPTDDVFARMVAKLICDIRYAKLQVLILDGQFSWFNVLISGLQVRFIESEPVLEKTEEIGRFYTYTKNRIKQFENGPDVAEIEKRILLIIQWWTEQGEYYCQESSVREFFTIISQLYELKSDTKTVCMNEDQSRKLLLKLWEVYRVLNECSMSSAAKELLDDLLTPVTDNTDRNWNKSGVTNRI